jgi:hypothetical protein
MFNNTLTSSKTKTAEYQLDTYLPLWIKAFLTDRKAGNRAPGTLLFYKQWLVSSCANVIARLSSAWTS